ncbi:MAG: poly-beta-hydroxybutyrate polymerase N-terminal domain-containing protein [Rhodospirillaceae bacterium]|nr:poly-beta-hydroxybutyrate polymerase N-terminal domain-containing protein [Rhodospirillaceae bacterium]
MDDGVATNINGGKLAARKNQSASIEEAPNRSRDPGDLHDLDRMLHALEGHLTGSLSPTIISLALADWLLHLTNAPGKRLDLWLKACEIQAAALEDGGRHLLRAASDEPAPSKPDRRFVDSAWQQPPFDLLHQNYLRWEDWWQAATTGINGVKTSHERVVGFLTRQCLDAWSPANHLVSNPEVLNTTMASRGTNLLRGLSNLAEDLHGAQNRSGGETTAKVPHYEILYPRPLAAELAGALSGGAGLHCFHDQLAQSWADRAPLGDGRLPRRRHWRGARRHRHDPPRRLGPCLRLLPGRHSARHRGGKAGARRRAAAGQHDPAGGAD